MNDLFQGQTTESGPVECLGQTFPSDQARREHYLKLLADKLKDPDFRKIEGFPIGTDEDILAQILSLRISSSTTANPMTRMCRIAKSLLRRM